MPVRLAEQLAPHEVRHVRDLNWQSLDDREIAVRALGQFEAIVTLDQSFPAEIAGLEASPAIVVLSPRSHRLPHMLELLPRLFETLDTLRPGQVVRLFRPPPVLP